MEHNPQHASRVGAIYLLLGLAQAAHSIEEMRAHLYDFFWAATGVFHQYISAFPQFRMGADTFAVLNMSFIALLLATVPAVQAGKRWALFLAGLAGVIEVLNGIAHLAGAIVFGGYVPGAASAPLLLILGFFLLRELRRTGALRV
ncbi:MAG: HXXEE domain-containing protein [Terriglobia bacterium]